MPLSSHVSLTTLKSKCPPPRSPTLCVLTLCSNKRSPDYFFSFTENSYEISVAANVSIIDQGFLPFLTSCPDMGISPDIFRVLQVDDAGGQGASGKRISDLSEPLAQHKFSIFYMSTYQTDFVLVKERRMRQAVQVLLDHGFEFDQDSLDMYHHNMQQLQIIQQSNASAESLASAADSTTSSMHAATTTGTDNNNNESDIESNVLDNELRCAGLNPHYRSSWSTTMLKVMSFPELLSSSSANDDGGDYGDDDDDDDDNQEKQQQQRFFSYTATSDGISLLADKHILDLFEEEALFQDEDTVPLRVIQVNLAGTNLDRCGIVRSISHPLATEAHINLLYLSTFKSANIIVSADDIERAEEILQPDLEKMRDLLNDVVLEPLQ
ncbi:ACT domain-containing protein [Zychaea mexicana]|uniref:ACT domain-containing protein n=1 Tax=Zychaea mexicana TaxID=64656 RepID=UPI0022FEBAE5|nr:ACT domain-containing protein [Zychaea mexicana]KAI9474858.1 ACT domain-containing protein [Zychaea mexicana]